MDYYRKALSMKEITVQHRRYFHQNAETGQKMPLAQEYIMRALAAESIPSHPCAGGVLAEIGQGSRTILLRADMDALPMQEESGLPFASQTDSAHTCGHDLHAAMLLAAASLLKQNESALCGKVRLMFQPAEEILCGAKEMIEEGIQNAPVPDAALAVHVGPQGKVGECWYNGETPMMLSCDAFRITIHGKGGHSGYPHHTNDPLGTAVQIYDALLHLNCYESTPFCTNVLTIGSIHSGNAYNIIPETAVVEGSLRTDDEERRPYLLRRIREITESIAAAGCCTAEITTLAENPVLRCDTKLTEKIIHSLQSLPFTAFHKGIRSSGSDDFAQISSRIPSTYLFLSAGVSDSCNYPSHHPAVRFNEEVLPLGAAALAHAADEFLRKIQRVVD